MAIRPYAGYSVTCQVEAVSETKESLGTGVPWGMAPRKERTGSRRDGVRGKPENRRDALHADRSMLTASLCRVSPQGRRAIVGVFGSLFAAPKIAGQ